VNHVVSCFVGSEGCHVSTTPKLHNLSVLGVLAVQNTPAIR
jgi:hypothetical protein